MTTHEPYPIEFRIQIVNEIRNGRSKKSIRRQYGMHADTLNLWLRKHPPPNEKRETPHSPLPIPSNEANIQKTPEKARLLFVDIETLPNQGFFFDTISDRAICLDFITHPKSICTIAYKFNTDTEPTVLIAAEPYNDKSILEQLLPIFEQADYVIWHFGEVFDRKFIDGRLFVNGLPTLPPIASIDTYKMAKAKFGRTLNSNKLDHLGMLLGVGRKNHTDASLWVKCARGDLDAMKEMAAYNAQDITLLEAVYYKLAPATKNKVNINLLHDDPVKRCKPCGSENITLKGYELTSASLRHRYQCNDCKAWSTFGGKL